MQGKEKKSVKQILENLETEIRSSQNTLLAAVDIGKIRNCACFVSSSEKDSGKDSSLPIPLMG